MRFLANMSWRKVVMIAAAWPFVLLLVSAVAMWNALRSIESGGLAAISFEISLRGTLVIFGPPFALLLFRLIAGRFHPTGE